jgi:hypothetical protein
MHPDKDILCIMHGAGGNGKGVHRDAVLVDIGADNNHECGKCGM